MLAVGESSLSIMRFAGLECGAHSVSPSKTDGNVARHSAVGLAAASGYSSSRIRQKIHQTSNSSKSMQKTS